MKQKNRYVLLEVSDNRCDELVAALLKRDYIKVVDVNSLESRAKLAACPSCARSFSKVTYRTVDEPLLWDLLAILRGMKHNRSVVLYEEDSEIRPVDAERYVKVGVRTRKMAEILGLITAVTDGSTPTHFVNKKCMQFLRGDAVLSPAKVAISEGRVLDVSGELHIDQVKGKDGVVMSLRHDLRDAIKNIPKSTIDFVDSGQTMLL